MTVSPQAGGLQQIMNEVSRRLDQDRPPAPVRHERLDELGAFSLFDPLLADLRKQYLDARQNRIAAQAEFGVDDAMYEMALLMEDSAWCAMQTRYMEVRADRETMKKAQDLMEEERRSCEQADRQQALREKLYAWHVMEAQLRLKEADRKHQADMMFFFFWLYLMRNQPMLTVARPVYHFNRYAA